MANSKVELTQTTGRGQAVRQRVLEAAERLLRQGKAEFSMRDLATEAGVSFATPFNQFGSKASIMHALSSRRIDTMTQRFIDAAPLPGATDRLLLAIDIAVAVMLEEPPVNKAVMGWIGTAGRSPGEAWARSTALWQLALGAGEGLPDAQREQTIQRLPTQFAIAFRGALSFWTAGELHDVALGQNVRAIASTLIAGFCGATLPEA
jgi:AcrR family transcriptional regulator